MIQRELGRFFGKMATIWAQRMSALVAGTESRMFTIAALWALGFGLCASVRFAIAHYQAHYEPDIGSVLLYAGLAFAPLAALRLGDLAYPRGETAKIRSSRRSARAFALYPFSARWRRLEDAAARRHPAFGTTGLLAALALGLLGNIGFRCGEFLMAMPPEAVNGPGWARILFAAMMFDALLFSILYAFAFVMAVRHAPGFPRMLILIWLCDLVAQLLIAQAVATSAIPADVGPALATLLLGNFRKTLISVTIWLPYLLLSTRVNVTFRYREPLRAKA